jgi:pentatricopeptide repeat protein
MCHTWNKHLSIGYHTGNQGLQLHLLLLQIRALGQGGEWRRALAAFDEMRGLIRRGANAGAAAPRPNARTYGIAIGACHACGQWRRVLDLYADMRGAGLEPDGNALQTVISACEKLGAWEEAEAVGGAATHCLRCCCQCMHASSPCIAVLSS